jgi:hypothetical protein
MMLPLFARIVHMEKTAFVCPPCSGPITSSSCQHHISTKQSLSLSARSLDVDRTHSLYPAEDGHTRLPVLESGSWPKPTPPRHPLTPSTTHLILCLSVYVKGSWPKPTPSMLSPTPAHSLPPDFLSSRRSGRCCCPVARGQRRRQAWSLTHSLSHSHSLTPTWFSIQQKIWPMWLPVYVSGS